MNSRIYVIFSSNEAGFERNREHVMHPLPLQRPIWFANCEKTVHTACEWTTSVVDDGSDSAATSEDSATHNQHHQQQLLSHLPPLSLSDPLVDQTTDTGTV
ncbi:unnamed protein product [Mesocestoides corti]|uniref:Uncharacterized protein n=1 Tax=Mesocestoides corti TaxID=53468 RepID=A0A0R3UH98_MESCO|nr:unnamed protein product [Mesocestoides corti]